MNKTMQARKQEAVQTAIFNAAIELFSRKGFNETTVDEIAEAAGVSQRSFFRYFPAKADVLGFGIPRNGAVLVSALAACPTGMSEIEVIRAVVLAGTEFSMKQPSTRQVIEITARNDYARQAHAAKIGELELRLSEAYAARFGESNRDRLRPRIMAKLTMLVHDLTISSWFMNEAVDCASALEIVLTRLSALIGSIAPQTPPTATRLS